MLTLTLPAHTDNPDIISKIRTSSLQVRILRDSKQVWPELSDDFSYARGREAILQEIEDLVQYRNELSRSETDCVREGCLDNLE